MCKLESDSWGGMVGIWTPNQRERTQPARTSGCLLIDSPRWPTPSRLKHCKESAETFAAAVPGDALPLPLPRHSAEARPQPKTRTSDSEEA